MVCWPYDTHTYTHVWIRRDPTHTGGKVYRFGDVNDKEMDALLTKGADADENMENGMWIDSAPMPYSWAYGDTVHYKLHTPVPVDPKKVHWRVTNGASASSRRLLGSVSLPAFEPLLTYLPVLQHQFKPPQATASRTRARAPTTATCTRCRSAPSPRRASTVRPFTSTPIPPPGHSTHTDPTPDSPP